MKKLSDKEIKLFQFLDKNVGDEQDKKTAIKYLKEYLGFTPEEVLKYYSLWYYSSGSDYETYEYDEEGELLNFINSISTLSSEQIDEITDDLYDSGKLDKLLGDFFNANCGGWRSTTPCITFESGGITVELDRENWREYFSGLGEDDLWMYDNAFSSYSDYYEEVMEDEFDYAYYNDDTIKYLETIAILAGQNSWPGKNNEKINEGEIKDFLNKTLPSSNVEDIIDNYLSEVSVELTRARLEAVRYCYNSESKYNTNETSCNSGDYCIFIPYEDLKELIINKNMLNLSELKDAEINDDIYLNDCYYDTWLDKEGHDSCTRELNRSLERTIEKITEDDELDLEQLIKDRKEFYNMLDKFGFRQYASTTSGGYYKSEDGKIDLHTDNINFKERKIKFTYEGKTHMVPFEDFPNWVGGSVLDLNESVKIKKKLLKEQKENITKISIFDFDGTLMDTPHPEEGKKEWEEFTGKKYPHIGWWGKPESLDDAVFDIQPIESTVSDYKKEMSNPDTMVIMLTGRLPHQSEQIEELLALHNINFDEYHYKSNGDTLTSKINTIKSLLHRYPNVSEIEMWEDREPHALSFEQWGKDNNINLNVNLVGSDHITINESTENNKEKFYDEVVKMLRKPPYGKILIGLDLENSDMVEIFKKLFKKDFIKVKLRESTDNVEQSLDSYYLTVKDENNTIYYEQDDSSGIWWEKWSWRKKDEWDKYVDSSGKKYYHTGKYRVEDEDIEDDYPNYLEDEFYINESISPKEKYINSIVNNLTPPYFYKLRSFDVPEDMWEGILSNIFNTKVTYSDNSTLRFLTVTEPTEWYVNNEDDNLIYVEEDSGFWTQMEYNESGKLIHQIDRDHNENIIVPMDESVSDKLSPEEKFYHKLASTIEPPYFYNLRTYDLNRKDMIKVLSLVFGYDVIPDGVSSTKTNLIVKDGHWDEPIYSEWTNHRWIDFRDGSRSEGLEDDYSVTY